MKCNFILYVKDQDRSMEFYRFVLALQPTLHVPGMTEFQLGSDSVLGLMPEKGIKRLLGSTISDPEQSNGIARAEVYFSVDMPEKYLERASQLGAKLLSPLEKRNWGDIATK